MPTQKTRIGGGNPPDEPQNLEDDFSEVLDTPDNTPPQEDEDLGIPEMSDMAEDPTGYAPPTSPVTHAGRQMRPMESQHLKEAHERYAGKNVRMTGEHVRDDPAHFETTPQPPRPDNDVAAQARNIMPQAFQTQQQPHQPNRHSSPTSPHATNAAQPSSELAAASQLQTEAETQEAANNYEYLLEALAYAEDAGDIKAIAYIKSMLNRLEKEFSIEEEIDKRERHPVLQKFLSNLGIERIKPAEREWAGTKWMFYPVPPRIDRWVNATIEDSYNVAAVEIAATVVGLDGVPLFEVLNIPVRKKHKVAAKEGTGSSEVSVTLYSKKCDCGKLIDADAEECSRCGAKNDKFDMPPELRLLCTQQFYDILDSKFGPYEELHQLVEIKDSALKSRRFDKEDLYGPFLTSLQSGSSEPGKTP